MNSDQPAWGVVELRGWLALIDVVDAMSKSAEVELVGYSQGLNTSVVVIAGAHKPVLAVLEVAKSVALQYDEVAMTKMVPNPHPNTQSLIQQMVGEKNERSDR